MTASTKVYTEGTVENREIRLRTNYVCQWTNRCCENISSKRVKMSKNENEPVQLARFSLVPTQLINNHYYYCYSADSIRYPISGTRTFLQPHSRTTRLF